MLLHRAVSKEKKLTKTNKEIFKYKYTLTECYNTENQIVKKLTITTLNHNDLGRYSYSPYCGLVKNRLSLNYEKQQYSIRLFVVNYSCKQ